MDEAVEVGPSGPATAHESGVVLIDRHDALFLARRTPTPERAAPGKTPVAGLDRPREDFARYGRGPAIAGGDAYWVSQGRLVTRRLDGSGDLKILATDARKGTRVAALERSGAAPLVAYVTTPDAEGTARAKLWTNTGSGLVLTAEGAGTSSVALIAQKAGTLVVTLDGRSGMTPLHVRRLDARGQGFSLGADVVAWVGASAQGGTEVFAGSANDGDDWAFVAIEQDIRHFGLAAIHLGQGSRHDAPASFTTYDNGLNTAPVAATRFCGRLAVAFVVPAAAQGSEQELLVAPVGPDGVEAGVVVARRRAFADCSLAAVSDGALLAFTADQRTFAVSLRCPKR